MPRAKQFDVAEKSKIMAWSGEGIPFKEIAERLGRNVAAVRKIAAKLREVPLSSTPPPAKRRSGRPRLTDPRQDELLRRYVLKHPFKTAKDLKREVPGFAAMSVRRLQEILRHRLNLPSRVAAAKPLLTEKMARRYVF